MPTVYYLLTQLAIYGYKDNLPHTAATGGTLHTMLNIVIGVVAAISVLFAMIGGMRFVVSAGDPQAAGRARSTLIFAIVGLLISIIAEGIVSFVLSNSTLGGL